jgi:hypothetical protein
MAVGSITRAKAMTSDVSHTAVAPAVSTTKMLINASTIATIATISDFVAFLTVPPVRAVNWLPTDGTAHRTFDLDTEQLELARRCCEPVGVAHHSTSIKKNDKRIIAVEQIVDLIKEVLNLPVKFLPKCHGSEFPLRNLRALCRDHGWTGPLHPPLAIRA